MGCWNGTCLISNLPIKAGEKVVAFIIEYASYDQLYSGTCYPWDYARPISLPIYAEYDDYGGIEKFDEDSLAIKHLLHLFNTGDIVKLIDNIERDRQTVISTKVQKEVGVGLVMIHQDIFDKLVSTHGSAYDSLTPGVNKKEIIQDIVNYTDTDYNANFHTNFVFDTYVGITERQHYINMLDFTLQQKSTERVHEFVDSFCKIMAIERDMSALRKIWLGPSGKGSQSDEYNRHLFLSGLISEHARLRIKEYKES